MTDKIDIMAHLNDFIGRTLAQLLVGHESMIANNPNEDKTYNVEVRINGKEVSFIEMCGVLEGNVDRQVKLAAIKLLQDRFNTMNDALYRLEQKVISAACDEFGVWEER